MVKLLLQKGSTMIFNTNNWIIAPKTLNYLAFQFFDFEHTWWRLFQKHVVCTNFDFYVLLLFIRYVLGDLENYPEVLKFKRKTTLNVIQ